MNGRAKHYADGSAERPVETEERVSGETRENGTSSLAPEVACRQRFGRLQHGDTESCHQQRMFRNMQHWAERVRSEVIPSFGNWANQAPPGLAVFAKRPLGRTQIVLKHHCGSIIKRMCERRIALDPFKPVIGKRQRF
jgi:hypothetical protein